MALAVTHQRAIHVHADVAGQTAAHRECLWVHESVDARSQHRQLQDVINGQPAERH